MALNLVLIGVAVALDPLPLMAFLVVLPSKRGVRKGAAFSSGGWRPWGSWSRSRCSPRATIPPSRHGALARGPGGEDRHWGHPGRDCGPSAPQEGEAEEAEEATEVAGAVDTCPRGLPWVWRPSAAMGPDRRGRGLIMEANVQSAELPRAVSCSASWLRRPTWRSRSTPVSGLVRARCSWLDSGLDRRSHRSVIIWWSLILGFWLIATDVGLILS